ncbi:hypothetical protein [Streptomyces pseudogriseolus]|uniref:hypothetical protein n=1 Tax=Streptomyces pseudogriseolus TaxID=36817 RepID=UPI003FA326BE
MSPRPKSAVARPGRAARARAAALRTQVLQSVFLPLRQDRTAQLRYAAILDGHTVNLHARLPESAGLPESAEVVLSRGRQTFTAEARVYEGPDGEVLVDAVVLLGAEVGGAPTEPGRWRLRLRLRSGRRTRVVPLLLVTPPVPYSGPTKPMAASSVTGERHRLGRSFRGSARVVSTGARPSAEVLKVHLTHAGVTVDFRLLGIRAEQPWVEFVASGRRLEQPVTSPVPGVLRVNVPLDRMPPRGNRPDHWDVVLCGADGRRLRLGRRLHDVRNPLRVFAMRSLAITPPGLPPMIVQPRYTPAGNLRVTCTRMPEAG